MEASVVAAALLGGIAPALFWLWFWLRQDHARPEPKSLIITSFLAGMAVVVLVLPLQQFAVQRFSGENLIFVWVIIEEVLKYAAALAVVLWHRAVDEPVDVIVYLITVALGFAALENALFIFTPLAAGEITQSILTGQFRFLGATLLHVLASGVVGVMIAFAFYKSSAAKVLYGTFGLFIAIVLHALFNFSIIGARGTTILIVFFFVWLGIIALLIVFEKVKQLGDRHRTFS